MIRSVASIDEHLCNGCGECVPACEEGSIRVVRGKARLASESRCDGLGACLGHCPQGAIRIERREAAPFHQAAARRDIADLEPTARHASGLAHWPVQLRLIPVTAPALYGARLLVAADCVPVAYTEFHSELLRGRVVVIACPKLDDTRGYVERFSEMIRRNDLAEIVVAHMEVPCCTGVLHMVLEARQLAASDVAVSDVSIGVSGQLIERRQILAEPLVFAGNEPARCQATGVE